MATTTTPKTISDFNDYLSFFFGDVRPDIARGVRRIDTYKYNVFEQLFGASAFGVGPAERELKLGEFIIFEDSPASAVGVKAKGFTSAGMALLMKELEHLRDSKVFYANLVDRMNADPTLKQHLERIEHTIISTITHRRGLCNIIVVQPNNPALQQSALDAGDPDKIFGFGISVPSLLQPFANVVKRIKNLIEDYTKGKENNDLKTIVQIKEEVAKRIGSSFSIVTWAAIFSGVRELFGKIPILLGPVPLKHVDYVEVARSGKILKFRATGSVFLAKQEGGDDAIKIEGTMYKVEFLTMFLLWGLFIYGQSKFKEMENIPGFSTSGVTDIFEVRKLNDLIMTDSSLQKPSYEFHQTFPFVSRHFIIPNCYIETILIEDKLPLKDVLKYSILLRTYEKPKQVNWVQGKQNKRLYGIPSKTLSAKVCEYSLNLGWRMLNATGWLIDETEWKIGSAMKEGVLDTYYDVDWSTIASVAYLNLMGAVT